MTNPMRAGKTDGRLFPVTREDLVRGAVLRTVHRSDGSVPSFSDCVVLNVLPASGKHGEETVRLARPFAYVNCSETTSPGVLTGVEQFEVSVERLLADDSAYSAVVQSTGLVATHLT